MPAPPTPPTARRRAPRRVLGVVAVVLVGLYAVRLAGLYGATRRAASLEAHLAAEVDALGTEVAALETEAVRAGTDAYAERWAREERGWTLPGDHPFAVAVVTPQPSATPPPAATPKGALARLRHWLRGGR